MMQCRNILAVAIALAVLAAAGLAPAKPLSAAETAVSRLSAETHFHGLAVDAANPARLILATHHGVYAVSLDGKAERISRNTDDYMGFTPHPTNPKVLYGSGHPQNGGNLGFITSEDGGRNWKRLSPGFRGPVDFHHMDVSRVDPGVIYGVHGGLQVSRDGGRNWRMVGPAPDGLIDLAASAKDVNTLYAATRDGLLRSADGGRTWEMAYIHRRPVTMVQATSHGELYAFVAGTGLVRTTEPGLDWRTVAKPPGDAYMLHLAVDPGDERILYAVTLQPRTRRQAILASRDGGRSWAPLGSDNGETGRR